jgi:serine/threonine-protein kinase RsbW
MPKERVSISNRLDQIEHVGSAVERCAREAGFDDRANYACQLAVGEACENIIKHGYGDHHAGSIEVVIEAAPMKIVIELRDSAPPFDAAKKPDCQIWQPDDPPIGGLGMRIIHRVMDNVEYQRNGSQNLLKLSKSIAKTTD